MTGKLFYGAGKVAEYIYNHSKDPDTVIGIIQTVKNAEKWHEKPVYSLEEINLIDFDEIWMTNADIATLYATLNKGIEKDKIIICNKPMCDEYCIQNHGILDIKYLKQEAEEYERTLDRSHGQIITGTMERALEVSYLEKEGGSLFRHEDYVRYATLELLVQEIDRRNVKGDVAELGVYQGRFAACINARFQDRKLYLFDTFEGFDRFDTKIEITSGFSTEQVAFKGRFSETDEGNVLSKMKYPNNCIICKGWFPDTIPKQEIQYAFVSLDCDLYKPTSEGIKYFYPRLSEGGYIMIHDYNNNGRWLGIKQAIDEFEEEYGYICKVPIPDIAGSLILTK